MQRVSLALLLAIALSALALHYRDHQRVSMLKRGDFPAFYAAAELVASGRADALYSAAAQQEVENIHWPSLGGAYYHYAYPPFVALMLAPLAALPPLAAKYVFILAMLLSLFLAARLIVGIAAARTAPGSAPAAAGNERWKEIAVFAGLLSFAPLCTAVVAGQNTALSMLLVTAAAWLLGKNGRAAQVLAGACLGLWLFKPHFAFTAVAAVLALGHYAALAGFLAIAVLYFLAASAVSGPAWPAAWLAAVSEFAAPELAANGHQFISLPGGLEAIALFNGVSAARIVEHRALSYGAGVVLLILAVFRLSSIRKKLAATSDKVAALLTCAPLAVFVSPHAMYYDFGISLLPLLIDAASESSEFWKALGLIWILGLAAVLVKDVVSVQPLFVVLTGIVFWSWRRLEKRAAGASEKL